MRKMMRNTNKGLRVCLAASGGGHLSQLLKLSESWKSHETFCVTTTDVIGRKTQEFKKVYVVGECNREHPLQVAKVLLRCLRLVFREKPHVVISTGAAVGCITCYLCKLFGAKIIWVDSITNIKKLSLSGRMVKYISDLFLVQWPKLAKQHKNIEYRGAII